MSTENIDFLVESESTCTKEAMQNVVKEVSRLEREREREELQARDAEGLRRAGGSTARSRQKYHFTLIRYACTLCPPNLVRELLLSLPRTAGVVVDRNNAVRRVLSIELLNQLAGSKPATFLGCPSQLTAVASSTYLCPLLPDTRHAVAATSTTCHGSSWCTR